MTAIRLFVLDELSRGVAHGHQLRTRAKEEHTDVWTDIQVGGVYATLKRLSTEGLIEAVRTETAGHYPERTVYALTDAGREALTELHHRELRQIVFRMDPFDLALQRASDVPGEELEAVLNDRRDEFAARAATLRREVAEVDYRLNEVERLIVEYLIGRLDYEVVWHAHVVANLERLTTSYKEPRGT